MVRSRVECVREAVVDGHCFDKINVLKVEDLFVSLHKL